MSGGEEEDTAVSEDGSSLPGSSADMSWASDQPSMITVVAELVDESAERKELEQLREALRALQRERNAIVTAIPVPDQPRNNDRDRRNSGLKAHRWMSSRFIVHRPRRCHR